MYTTISREEYMQIYRIVGAAMEVHSQIGRGMEEAVYQEALEYELADRDIDCHPQYKIKMQYKHHQLRKEYFADIYSNGIIVELKAVTQLCSDHRSQLFNYMRITKHKRGVLVNFGERSIRCERYVYQEEDDDFALLTEDNIHQYVRS